MEYILTNYPNLKLKYSEKLGDILFSVNSMMSPIFLEVVAAMAAVAASCGFVQACFSERHRKSLKACATLGALLAVLATVRPRAFTELMNPWRLSVDPFALLFVVKCALLALFDQLVAWLVIGVGRVRLLPFRTAYPNVKGLAKLEWIDYMYLALNSWIEYVFVMHVCWFVTRASPGTSWRASDVGWLNTGPALWLLFAVDDAMYAPCHRLMHWKPFYFYVHKHHHRQTLPRRGYLDAGNEHPVEQLIGLGALWCTLHVVARTVGLHAYAILAHFMCYAALAVLNHMDRDVRFKLLGFDYCAGAHEMHHRHPNCNMAQYFMVWDRLMGTYRPYVP